ACNSFAKLAGFMFKTETTQVSWFSITKGKPRVGQLRKEGWEEGRCVYNLQVKVKIVIAFTALWNVRIESNFTATAATYVVFHVRHLTVYGNLFTASTTVLFSILFHRIFKSDLSYYWIKCKICEISIVLYQLHM